MTAILANGIPLLSATMSIPKAGPWVIDVSTASPLASGDPVTVNDGAGDWMGTVKASGGVAGIYHCRIVGGKGKLSSSVPPKHWRGSTLGAVLAATLADGGEIVSPLILPSVQATSLQFWTRTERSLSASLAALAEAAGLDWRALQDGTVWLGTGQPMPASPLDEQPLLLDTQLDIGLLALSVESFSVVPGDTVADYTVTSVRYELGTTLRAWAYVETP